MSIFDLFSSDPQKRIEAYKNLNHWGHSLGNSLYDKIGKFSWATIISVVLFVILPLFAMLQNWVQDIREMGFFLWVGVVFAVLVSKWLQWFAKPPKKKLDTSNQTVIQNDEWSKTFEELQFESKLETMKIAQPPKKSFFSFLDPIFEKLEGPEWHTNARKFALALLRFSIWMIFLFIICNVFRGSLLYYITRYLHYWDFFWEYSEMITDFLIWTFCIGTSFYIAKSAFKNAHDEKHFPLDRYPFDIWAFLKLSISLFFPMLIVLTGVVPNILARFNGDERRKTFFSDRIHLILGAAFLACLIAFLRVRPRKRKVNIAKKSSDSQNDLSTVREGE